MFSFYTTALAASVPSQTFPGNDTDPNNYLPPEGCIHYQVPNSDLEEPHTIIFNDEGSVDPEGFYVFTVTIGTIPGNTFTQVLSWTSNFPIYALIVNGGGEFNLYQYDNGFRGDTNLVAPVDASGLPANVNHVSIVICPNTFTTTDTSSALQLGLLSSTLIVNTIFQIISTILLGLLTFFMFLLLFGSGFNIFGSCIRRFHKKPKPPRKDHCDKKGDKDCNHKPKDCDNKKDKNYYHKKPDNYCDKKIDPGSGYSLDCNNKNAFPYSNNYHSYF